MIRFFPELLPDEVLYSGLARYCAALGIREYPRARAALFGDQRGHAGVALPGRLGALVGRLPPGTPYTVDRLVTSHTMLPYFRPFKRPDQVARVEQAMTSDGSAGPEHRIQVLAGATRVRRAALLSHCATCVAADRARHGVAYWHRAHQLPGVLCCHVHGTPLSESPVQSAVYGSRLTYSALEDALPPAAAAPRTAAGSPAARPTGRTRADDVALRLARDTAWVLDAAPAGPGLPELRRRYHDALRAAGFGRGTVQIRVPALREAVTAHFGTAFLLGVGAPTAEVEDGTDWVGNAVRATDTTLHPLQHLLLCQFLDLHPADLLGAVSAPPTRGGGEVAPGTAAPPAGVSAVAAAQQGTQRGTEPSTGPAAREHAAAPRRPVGRKMGAPSPEWEERLRASAADRGVSLCAMARALGVSPTTVKRHAHRLGVARAEWTDPPARARTAPERKALRTQMRTAYTRLRDKHPKKGRAELDALDPMVVRHLRRHDAAWLKDHQPPERRTPPRGPRVDWPERDATLRVAVDEALARLLARPRPARATVTALLRQMSCLGLLPKLGRLPATDARLREVAESRQAYADRRLATAAAQCRAEGAAPAPWELLRRAGVGARLWASMREHAAALAADLHEAAVRGGAGADAPAAGGSPGR